MRRIREPSRAVSFSFSLALTLGSVNTWEHRAAGHTHGWTSVQCSDQPSKDLSFLCLAPPLGPASQQSLLSLGVPSACTWTARNAKATYPRLCFLSLLQTQVCFSVPTADPGPRDSTKIPFFSCASTAPPHIPTENTTLSESQPLAFVPDSEPLDVPGLLWDPAFTQETP